VCPFEANRVESEKLCPVSCGQRIRRDIQGDPCEAADKCMSPNPTKMMNGGETTDDGMIFNDNMASKVLLTKT
jgi:hypothetical protein